MIARPLLVGLLALAMLPTRQVTPKPQIHMVAERDTLAGIDAVAIVVDDIPKALEGVLTAEAIDTAVALQLKEAGIKVVDAKSAAADLDFLPQLSININAVRTADGAYAYALGVGFKRSLPIPGRADARRIDVASAVTWSRGSVGIARDADAIKANLRAQVDEFAKDFAAANPKKSLVGA